MMPNAGIATAIVGFPYSWPSMLSRTIRREFGIMLGHSGVHMLWVSLACGLVVTDGGNLDLGSDSALRLSGAQFVI